MMPCFILAQKDCGDSLVVAKDWDYRQPKDLKLCIPYCSWLVYPGTRGKAEPVQGLMGD